MRDFLTPERVANKIQLLRTTFYGSFLLVEGSSDKVFYQRFVHSTECKLEITAGKPSSKIRAIKILEILEKSKFQGILAIVDADFDRLEASPHYHPNLLRTDTHDLETLLINSPALEKIIAEFGSEEKVKKLDQDLRSILLEAGVSIGYLRWISHTEKLNLTFEGMTFNKFLDEKTLQFNELSLIQEVKKKSENLSLSDEYLQQRSIEKKSNNYDPWQVCCGHDLVEILSLGLRKAIGSNNSSEVKPDCLERSLRLAYEESYFSLTQLYLELSLWESNNHTFKVLKDQSSD
ncbi:MAG: DUF4435 domain-containing protein [Geitlerinemataceae cyanobacterium]